MFILNETLEYDWPVDVQEPRDGGTYETRRFTARFRVAPKERVDAVIVDGDDDDFLMEVVVGWNDEEVTVQDGAGNRQPLPFTADNLRRLIRVPYVRAGLFRAYVDSISGRKSKN